jgi:hypothetical protein
MAPHKREHFNHEANIREGGETVHVVFKEVLRREIQGLKVWPVYRSQVFSITGTYFRFILSLLSGLICKRTPEAGMLFCCHSSCAE